MEPPAKRLRLSPRDETALQPTQTSTSSEQAQFEPGILAVQGEISVLAQEPPTRTVVFPRSQRRPLNHRGIRILPRAPDVTVTANVVNIGILDGTSEISNTQIPAPTAATILPLSLVGSLTVPGFVPTTGPSITGASGTIPGGSLSGSLAGSTSTNGTSNDHTVTVTATSTLLVPIKNGTITWKSSSYRGTLSTSLAIPANGSLSTSSSDYNFGDISTSFLTGPSNSYATGAAATNTTSTSSTATSTAGSGGGVVLTQQQQQVVGGVVGGVAGVALVLLGILFLLKWYRQQLSAQGRLPEQFARHRQLPSGDNHDYTPSTAMAEPSSSALVPIGTLKQSLQKLRQHSNYTLTSNTTDRSPKLAPESVRSFQRVNGRKIPSVLLTGGDGYENQGPGSPSSVYSSMSRSRDVSQVSSFRESNNLTNPFLDPPTEDNDFEPIPLIGLAASRPANSPRPPPLGIQTMGLSMISSNRQSDGTVSFRPSPARTPTTTSPSSTSLILPLHTPPLMSNDIPEMPPLNPFRSNLNPRKFSEESLNVKRPVVSRSMSAISARSSKSVGGKFKEEI